MAGRAYEVFGESEGLHPDNAGSMQLVVLTQIYDLLAVIARNTQIVAESVVQSDDAVYKFDELEELLEAHKKFQSQHRFPDLPEG